MNGLFSGSLFGLSAFIEACFIPSFLYSAQLDVICEFLEFIVRSLLPPLFCKSIRPVSLRPFFSFIIYLLNSIILRKVYFEFIIFDLSYVSTIWKIRGGVPIWNRRDYCFMEFGQTTNPNSISMSSMAISMALGRAHHVIHNTTVWIVTDNVSVVTYIIK